MLRMTVTMNDHFDACAHGRPSSLFTHHLALLLVARVAMNNGAFWAIAMMTVAVMSVAVGRSAGVARALVRRCAASSMLPVGGAVVAGGIGAVWPGDPAVRPRRRSCGRMSGCVMPALPVPEALPMPRAVRAGPLSGR